MEPKKLISIAFYWFFTFLYLFGIQLRTLNVYGSKYRCSVRMEIKMINVSATKESKYRNGIEVNDFSCFAFSFSKLSWWLSSILSTATICPLETPYYWFLKEQWKFTANTIVTFSKLCSSLFLFFRFKSIYFVFSDSYSKWFVWFVVRVNFCNNKKERFILIMLFYQLGHLRV